MKDCARVYDHIELVYFSIQGSRKTTNWQLIEFVLNIVKIEPRCALMSQHCTKRDELDRCLIFYLYLLNISKNCVANMPVNLSVFSYHCRGDRPTPRTHSKIVAGATDQFRTSAMWESECVREILYYNHTPRCNPVESISFSTRHLLQSLIYPGEIMGMGLMIDQDDDW